MNMPTTEPGGSPSFQDHHPGLIGAAVAWSAVALVGSYELLMIVILSSQVQADADRPEGGYEADPLQEQGTELFTEQLAADRVPSIRAIRYAEVQVVSAQSLQSTSRLHW
jgi:hypothetical protein